ncbi:CPBP family intramembrane glutamic endopeptidase [Clostridium nigeriense]|uniref:CPBP family intramembrane glutamic endopeptidase n=1 Tax=Clostridium nigeriense TaxID=1805470 RepID=UPI003D357EE6
MTSIKNNNKFKLVSMCITLYLYEFIITTIIIHNHEKLKTLSNKSDVQGLIGIILMSLLLILPIIIGSLTTNLKNLKLSIKNNIKFKIIIRKIFYAIMFSVGVIFIIFPLATSNHPNFKIIYMVELLIYALPEEIIFRWFFQEKFEKIISNKFIATLLVALLFAILHLPNDLSSSTNITSILFSLGNRATFHFFLNFIKEKSNSIVVPTIVHALYNYLLNYA